MPAYIVLHKNSKEIPFTDFMDRMKERYGQHRKKLPIADVFCIDNSVIIPYRKDNGSGIFIGGGDKSNSWNKSNLEEELNLVLKETENGYQK